MDFQQNFEFSNFFLKITSQNRPKTDVYNRGEKTSIIQQRGGVANALQKKVIALLGAVLLLGLNFNVVSYSDTVNPFENDRTSLTYEITNNCTDNLEIQNGTAHCTSIAKGTDAVNITVTQTLQKHWGLWIWEDVGGATWTTILFVCTIPSRILRAESIV